LPEEAFQVTSIEVPVAVAVTLDGAVGAVSLLGIVTVTAVEFAVPAEFVAETCAV
jgi:hypothetical protein